MSREIIDVNNHSLNRVLDHESFKTMAMYLLFSSTYDLVPVASIIDMKIKENIEKGGSAKNAALWNWTPLQKSLLDADLPRVIMTSYWSTGKTRILFMKALMLAKDGKFVIFVLHYSQVTKENKNIGDEEKITNEDRSSHTPAGKEATALSDSTVTATVPNRKGFQKYLPNLLFFKKDSNNITEKAVYEDNVIPEKAVNEHNESTKGGKDFSKTKEPQQTNFADHAPILLYHSLMNEIEKESEKNPQVKVNIKLMVSKDLKEDVLRTNVFDNGRLAESL